MEHYKEILINVLKDEDVSISFPNLKIDTTEIVHLSCYQALMAIKTIFTSEELDDKECFQRIEKIVSLFEALGSDGGSRHEFG